MKTQSEEPKNGELAGWNHTEGLLEELQVQEAIEKSFLEQRNNQEPSRKEMYEMLTLMYSK